MFDEVLAEQVKAEHAKQDKKLTRFAQAQDPLTVEINRIADKDPESYLAEGTHPHSGNVNASMTLRYDAPEIATDRFEKGDPNVYARNGGARLTQLGEILKLLDPGIAEIRITNFGMSAFNVVLQTIQVLDKQLADNEAASGKRFVTAKKIFRRLRAAVKIALGQDPRPHIVASNFLFGGCKVLLKRFANVTFIDGQDLAAWERAIRPNTAAFFIETPGNPTMENVNIAEVSKIAHSNGRDILVVVDNSLALAAQQPLKDGADIVVSSTTKYFGIEYYPGGFVAISEDGSARNRRLAGLPANSHVNWFLDHIAYMGATQGSGDIAAGMIENARHLPGRLAQQIDTATKLARHLRDEGINVIHPCLDKPYPQLKGISVFSIDLGSQERAFAFIKQLNQYGFPQINNFGGPKTATTHCYSTTHHSLSPEELKDQGITEGLIRITVGIEDADIVLKVFDAALAELNARPELRLPNTPRSLAA